MNKSLSEVISDILSYHGALVEETDGGCLEVLCPDSLSSALGFKEHAILCFSYDKTGREAIYASYDSELFKAMAGLLKNKGEFSAVSFRSSLPNTEKLLKVMHKKITLNNATFRLENTELKSISYLLCYFKYIAISDEKHEGIIQVLINELNLSAVPFENGGVRLEDSAEELKDIERHNLKTVLQSSYFAGVGITKERLKEFIKSLERRLNRNIRRVHEYYETLKNEAIIAAQKKAVSIEDRPIKGEEVDELLKKKINAIETECKWKIQDLITKYSLNIQIEPVSVIRVETQSPVFWINIKRRLATRSFPITYNPVIKQLDALPCELCFNPTKPYYICDDKLHIICSTCFKICPDCGKQYCGVCYRKGCPRCNVRQ
ncbi:MAG: hypothetical protein LRZ90_04700 [Thermodesulfovibrionales bacterium]|nr:hypothetical protein [Thermodesulfovibrionales bacterium]